MPGNLWCRSARGLPARPIALAGLILGSGLIVGCKTATYRRDADKDAYGIIGQKENVLTGKSSGFKVETPYSEREPEKVPSQEIVDSRDLEPAAVREVDLLTALSLTAEHNRDYQTQREALFLAALSLSSVRHRYDWIASSSLEGTYTHTPGDDLGSGKLQLGLTRLFKTGARVTVGLTSNLLQYYTGDPRRSSQSLLNLDITQPLLRGAGAAVAAEDLTQAEREMVYAVRSFSRYQKTLAVEVASQYYRLLQQRDGVRNEYRNYRNLVQARARTEALSHDRLPAFQVDQARQNELSARNSYVGAVATYQELLDAFKIKLGLPLGARLQLRDEPLAELVRQGLPPVPIAEPDAVALALKQRLDLLNDRDRFDDAKRKVAVRVDALRMGLDLSAGTTLESNPHAPGCFNGAQAQTYVGAKLDLPLDRLSERNAYREQLISFERQLRTLARSVDDVKEGVRGRLRDLAQARQKHAIQQRSVELALRRVESANVLLQAGRVEVRDLLEAQSALVAAQNALTTALVDYHLARLELLRDLEVLTVDSSGFGDTLARVAPAAAPAPAASTGEEPLITPDELFRP